MTTCKQLLIAALLCLPVAAQAGELSISQPLSTWHDASDDAKQRLIDQVTDQLRASANINGAVSVPMTAVTQCVDINRAPDQLKIRDRMVTVTAGMIVMGCLKAYVPELRSGKYREDG